MHMCWYDENMSGNYDEKIKKDILKAYNNVGFPINMGENDLSIY